MGVRYRGQREADPLAQWIRSQLRPASMRSGRSSQDEEQITIVSSREQTPAATGELDSVAAFEQGEQMLLQHEHRAAVVQSAQGQAVTALLAQSWEAGNGFSEVCAVADKQIFSLYAAAGH